jgi:hypothetical protein
LPCTMHIIPCFCLQSWQHLLADTTADRCSAVFLTDSQHGDHACRTVLVCPTGWEVILGLWLACSHTCPDVILCWFFEQSELFLPCVRTTASSLCCRLSGVSACFATVGGTEASVWCQPCTEPSQHACMLDGASMLVCLCISYRRVGNQHVASACRGLHYCKVF